MIFQNQYSLHHWFAVYISTVKHYKPTHFYALHKFFNLLIAFDVFIAIVGDDNGIFLSSSLCKLRSSLAASVSGAGP